MIVALANGASRADDLSSPGPGPGPGRAVDASLPAPPVGEPDVRSLQRTALRLAGVDGARIAPLLRRVRAAAALPSLSVQLVRGVRELRIASGDAGIERITVDSGDTWRVSATASWSLDRLLFERDELAVLAEEHRLATRREALVTEISRLYYERRRLQANLALRPQATPLERAETRLRIDELAATLDGLTDGALSRSALPSPHRSEP